jgi:hypothetical protein
LVRPRRVFVGAVVSAVSGSVRVVAPRRERRRVEVDAAAPSDVGVGS